MRPRLIVVALLVCAAMIPAGYALAGKRSGQSGPAPFTFNGMTGSTQGPASVVDQQSSDNSPVANPLVSTPCFWNVDDHSDYSTPSGFLDPGGSASTSVCQVSDPNPIYAARGGVMAWWSFADHGYFGERVVAPSNGLSVTVCYQPQARCFTPAAASVSHIYVYDLCAHAVYRGNPYDPVLQTIPGSNGGVGVVTTVTLTVSNPTAHQVKNITGYVGTSSDLFFPVGCSGPNPPGEQFSYPFAWTQT